VRTRRIAPLAALPAAALALAPAALPSAEAPLVRFLDLTPPTVRGTHFVPGSSVRVTLVAGQTKLSRVIWASNRGGFVVRFGNVPREDRCSGKVILLASAATGQRASYRLPTMNCTTFGLERSTIGGISKPAIVGAADRAGAANTTAAVDKAGAFSAGSTGASR
jgi:hypothetical protein